jgi:hypothetical protein
VPLHAKKCDKQSASKQKQALDLLTGERQKTLLPVRVTVSSDLSVRSHAQPGGAEVTQNPVSRELYIQRANPCSAINFRVADNPPETPQGYLVNLNA